MPKKYIGIENEFTSFSSDDKTHHLNFQEYFNEFKRKQPNSFSNTFGILWSYTGNKLYCDNKELEIATPPVAVNKCFAARLSGLLEIGRDVVAGSITGLIHTGYSTHWNITYGKTKLLDYLDGISIPFHLFGLTPLSIGLNITRKISDRIQLAGDYIPSEEQINATALMLGAYSHAVDFEEKAPIIFKNAKSYLKKNFLPNGRDTIIDAIITKTGADATVTAQEYLEIFYCWIKPAVKELGTQNEIKTLEGFINGKIELEIDKTSFYESIYNNNGIDIFGIYRPVELPAHKNSFIICSSGKKRKTPLEGRLWGELIRQAENIKEIEWNNVQLAYSQKDYAAQSIEDIYRLSEIVNPALPKFRPPVDECAVPYDISEALESMLDKKHALNAGANECYDKYPLIT